MPGTQGASPNHKNLRVEPADHAIGRSRGGLTCKVHLVADGKGRPLSWVLTGGNVNDTTMMTVVLDGIRVPRAAKGIDWTKSIPEIDRQLYAKYGLDDDEIDFIEDHVKPMN